ncbi:hypothetical protein [Gallaecimonas mangrovi]|uniref:hypothetical protein n=1 Tax=Gallaecimonas mangrovi TaxID=2291597 RepID=UPI000E20A52E|nr:hypothetical protein [Gallaecimonas mangrovi]
MQTMRLAAMGLVLVLAGCSSAGVRPPEQPPANKPAAQNDEMATALKGLAATLPEGDVAVVKVANYSNRRIDTQALTEKVINQLSQDGRNVADLSASADGFDLLAARQAGREGGHQYLLYGQIREDGNTLRLRVMTLANGIIVWTREMTVPKS